MWWAWASQDHPPSGSACPFLSLSHLLQGGCNAVCESVPGRCGHTGSGPFLVQPECADGDASVHAVVEKLREENRVLRQKVTHVSV